MSFGKITEFDLDSSMDIAKETTLDEVKNTVTEMKTVVEDIKENGSSASSSGSVSDGDIINALLSDDERANEWAFRQPGIGRIINEMYELGSDELAACETMEQIAANATAIMAIRSNAAADATCCRNNVYVSGVYDLDPEYIISQGMTSEAWNVGDIIALTWNGVSTPFRVVHKNYYTSGKVILMSENVLTESVWSSSVNNYTSSTLRTTLTGSILTGFSDVVQSAMTSPSVVCHNGSALVTCNDKIWAPSYIEVGFEEQSNSNAPAAGSVFDYFNSGGSRIKTYNGTASRWWLRTPCMRNGTDRGYAVDTTGAYDEFRACTEIWGVVAAFEI